MATLVRVLPRAGASLHTGTALVLLLVFATLFSPGTPAAPAARAAGTGVRRAPAVAQAPPPPIAWSPCGSPTGYLCGEVRVPLDYGHRGGATLTLAVIERPASDPVGRPADLVFNPGGPGESGVGILPVLANLVPAVIAQRFNLVSFDERGTGASDRLRCGPSPDAAAATLPLPDAGTTPPGAARFAEALARSCLRRDKTLVHQVDTTTSARDMDRIRQALGVSRIDYWGLSYGTVLGSVYAHLFPDRVGAMVLDGAVDATQTLLTQAAREAPAIEASEDHFFATCAADPSCPLGPDPRASFERLSRSLSQHPLGAPGVGDTVPVSVGDLDTATLFYLSAPAYASGYGPALVTAMHGNGAPLRALSLDFELDIDGSSLVASQWAITCNDAAHEPDPARADALARRLARRDGTLAAFAVTYTLAGCLDWPVPGDPVTTVRVTGGPTILVVANTGDPNTPHAAAVALVHSLGHARLVTWDGWGHTWLLNGAADGCMDRAVSAYLLHGTVPRAGTTCR